MSTGVEILDPGELRRYVTVQQSTTEQDETGGFEQVWSDVIKAWAKIDPRAGREVTAAAQLYPDVDTLITLRWRPEPREDMSVLDEYGTRYDIKYVSDVELRHRTLVLGTVRRPPERNA